MQHQRTQVYLTPAQHRALRREAAERGVPMTAVLREAVDAWLGRRAGGGEERDFSALIGVADAGDTDADDLGSLARDAAAARLRRKLGAR